MSENPASGSEWKRTSLLGLLPAALNNLKSMAVALVAVGYSLRNADAGLALLLPGAAGLVALVAALGWLRWRYFRYLVGSEDIRVEKGLLGRQARSVPFERIQDVSLEEALVPRLLGLAVVRFETGAGGKDEITLAYVPRSEGERLRETVKARKAANAGEEASGQAGEEEAAGADPARTLFAMGPRRLLTFGVFEFSLVVFAVLAGAAQQFDFLLPFDLWNPENWPDLLSGWGGLLAQLGMAAQVVGAVLGLAALALVGLATGLLRTVLRDWGFRLEQTPKGLRRRRGLLTRTDVVMPLHRVQALTIGTGIIRRRFGWHSLSIVSLAQDSGSASHVAVPFGTLAEIAPVAGATGFALPGADAPWRRPSGTYRLHVALLAALPLLAGSGLLFLASAASPPEAPPLALPALALAALAGLVALRQLFLWRYERHALDARHLHVRRGWLAPRLEIAAREKLQSIEIAQGPLARRGCYASLRLGIAGGTLDVAGIPLAEARRLREELLHSVSAVDFSRLSAARPTPNGHPAPNPAAPEPRAEGGDQYMMP